MQAARASATADLPLAVGPKMPITTVTRALSPRVVPARIRETGLWMRLDTFARKSHMERTRAESLVFVVASTVIALATLFAVTWVAGFDHVAARLQAVQPIWFLVALGAEAVAYVGYVLSYREVSRVEEGPGMNARTRSRQSPPGSAPSSRAAGSRSTCTRSGRPASRTARRACASSGSARSSTPCSARRPASPPSSCSRTACTSRTRV